MGFFSETVVSSWVTGTRIADPDNLNNPMAEAILKAVLNNEDIPKNMLAVLLDGDANHLEEYYQMGLLGSETNGDEGYRLGLPEGTLEYVANNNDAIKEVLESNLGESINVQHVMLAPTSLEFYGKYLTSYFAGYSFSTATVHFGSNTTDRYYLDSVEPYVVPGYSEDLIELIYKPTIDILDDKADVRKYYSTPNENIVYQVTWNYINEPIQYRHYDLYDPANGTYPELDITETTGNMLGRSDYYPIVPIRLGKENMVDWAKQGGFYEEIYTTSVEILDTLNLSMVELTDAVMSVEDPDDLEDISDVFFLFGVPIYTEQEASIKYLMQYFSELHASGGITREMYYESMGSGFEHYEAKVNIIETKDALYENTLQYNYITNNVISGSIGSKGTFTNETYLYSNDIASNGFLDGDGELNTDYYYYIYHNSYIALREQITDGSYREIIVHGVVMINHINESDATLQVELAMSSEKRDMNDFYIPLNRRIFNNMSGDEARIVMYEAMILVTYSVHEEALKWYQSTNFTRILMAVATYFGVQSIASAIVAIVAQAATTAVLLALLAKMLVKALLVKWAINWLIEEIGGTLGLVLASMLSIYAMYVSGAKFNLEGILGGIKAVATNYNTQQQVEMKEIMEEYGEFIEEYEDDMAIFEKAEEMLGGGINSINPLMFMNKKPYFNPNQSADEFYNDALTQNIGGTLLELPDYYFDLALTLPELKYDGELNSNAGTE